MSSFNPTDFQKSNLEKLAYYLLSLPADYPHFDMTEFCTADNDDINPDQLTGDIHKCGAVACALGHSGDAGICVKNYTNWRQVSFNEYGMGSMTLYESPEWLWCFGPCWAEIDNTPHGAGKRILHLLRHGIPEDFDYDPKIYEHISVEANPPGCEVGMTISNGERKK